MDAGSMHVARQDRGGGREHLVGQERGHLSGALATVSGGPAAAADADASPHLRNMRGFTSGGTPRSGGPRYRVIVLW